MSEIINTVLEFIRNLTFGNVVVLMLKIIALCFIYVCVCEGIDAIKWTINCFLVGIYNYYTTKVQKKIETRVAIPYKKNTISTGELIDISNLTTVIPKLVAKIDIMTGRVSTEEVLKKRGIFGMFLYPYKKGLTKSIVAIPEKRCVEKNFVYVQSLINTLNLHYANWQELNPELWKSLNGEEIVAEEIVIPYLRSFRH